LGISVEDWTPLRALFRRADIWHLHHPDTVVYPRSQLLSFCGTLLFAFLLLFGRQRGSRILWTIRDLDSSDGLHPRLERWFWRFYLPRVDACICLSESGIERARQVFPTLREVPMYAVPHGHYLEAYPHTLSNAESRALLGLPRDTRVLLSFGLIRPYKNIPQLIDVFKDADMPNTLLLIVGKPFDKQVERKLRQRVGDYKRIHLHLDWITPEAVQQYFLASDLVVLPYRRVENSGAALLALSFKRSILAPDKGVLADHQKRFGPEWVRLYDGHLNAKQLVEACKWAENTDRPPIDLSNLSWRQAAEATARVYAEQLEP
jgi:glycosyltransferase involved in cell wall biosynthesis